MQNVKFSLDDYLLYDLDRIEIYLLYLS